MPTKQVDISYDPAKVTLSQLFQAVTAAEPIHGKRYQAALIVTVDDLQKNASKVRTALKKIKGADVASLPNLSPGEIAITLPPLPLKPKPTDHVKAAQVADAFEKAGVKISGLDVAAATGSAFDNDPKKKQPSSKTTKPKAGDDDAPDKSKTSRTTTPKTKPARDPATPSAKPKDESSDEKPRFQILGGGGDKVYLIDHETKNDDGKELKKFVKAGDRFGDYTVKELGDDDGLFVVLEHLETKEITRVEHEKKDKDKDGDKPKDEKDKDAKPKDDSEKKSDDKKSDN